MINELESAVTFVSDLLSKKVPVNKATIFRQTLLRVLVSHYQDHWFPEKPFRGSAYRCIRINHKMDPLISKAGQACGFTESQLFSILPNEFTMWVDPREVSYRIGEEGSIGLVYESEAPSPAPVPEPTTQRYTSSPSNLVSQASPIPRSGGSSPLNDNANSYRSHSPDQLHQLQIQQQQMQHQQQMQFQANLDFLRSCKDQLRYILPESSEAMNFEYLSTFVAS